ALRCYFVPHPVWIHAVPLLHVFYLLRPGDLRRFYSFPTRRSSDLHRGRADYSRRGGRAIAARYGGVGSAPHPRARGDGAARRSRSEEHTSELQSRENFVYRLLL